MNIFSKDKYLCCPAMNIHGIRSSMNTCMCVSVLTESKSSQQTESKFQKAVNPFNFIMAERNMYYS